MSRIYLLRCVFSPSPDVLVCVGSGMSGFVKKMHKKTIDIKHADKRGVNPFNQAWTKMMKD